MPWPRMKLGLTCWDVESAFLKKWSSVQQCVDKTGNAVGILCGKTRQFSVGNGTTEPLL